MGRGRKINKSSLIHQLLSSIPAPYLFLFLVLLYVADDYDERIHMDITRTFASVDPCVKRFKVFVYSKLYPTSYSNYYIARLGPGSTFIFLARSPIQCPRECLP